MTKEIKQAFDDRFAQEMRATIEGMRRVGAMSDADCRLALRGLNRAPLRRGYEGMAEGAVNR